MNNTISITALALLAVPVITSVANAQGGGGYDLSWFSIDDGGGTGTGGIYSASGTTGQPDAGTLTGGIYSLAGGFWAASNTLPLSYANWIAGFGLSGPAAAADGDPDNDGLQNGAEYIVGESPIMPGPPISATLTTSGGNSVFTFFRTDAAETPDVTLTLESGTDLASWPTVFNIGPNTSASSPGVSIIENGAAPDTISVTLAPGTATRVFARLKVVISP
jgi:hypothetical protein